MHDDTDRFVFPQLPDEAVVALEHFLEDFYAAFQNHYFAQLHRWYYDRPERQSDDKQIPLSLDRSF